MNENEDLYDDIFDQNHGNNYAEADINDLYGNIHNPEVAETALDKVRGLTTDNEKCKSQIAQLKNQISILNSINLELKTKNTNLEKNMKDMIETSRVEINRKNEQVRNLRAELDNVLFKRAARNINSRELEDLLKKYRPTEEPYSKLPTKPKPVVKKVVAMAGSPDMNSGNRQFVGKKRKRISLETNPSKKAKTEDNKENNVNPTTEVLVTAKKELVDSNSNQTKSEIKVDMKLNSVSTNPTASQTVTKPGLLTLPDSGSKPAIKPGHPTPKPKPKELDISLISNYVQDKPRKNKKQVLETRKELNPDSRPVVVTNLNKPKAEDKPVSKPLEPTNKPLLAKPVTAPASSDTSKNASKQKPDLPAKVNLAPEGSTAVAKSKRVYVSFDKPVGTSKTSKPSESLQKPTQCEVKQSVKSGAPERRLSLEASQDFDISIANKSKDIDLPIKLFNITEVTKEPKTPVSKGAKTTVTQDPKTPVYKKVTTPATGGTKTPAAVETMAPVSRETKTCVPKETKAPVSQEPKTPVSKVTQNLLSTEHKTPVSHETKTPVSKKAKTSQENKVLKVSKNSVVRTGQTTVSTEQEVTPVTSALPELEKSPCDMENNCSGLTRADDEASTSSQLKSPISRPDTSKTRQEWDLGRQLVDIFETKTKTTPRNKSKTRSGKESEEKADIKDTVAKKSKKGDQEVAEKQSDAKDSQQSPEKALYGSTRWNCEYHREGFRTRDDLRLHRSKGSCFKKRITPTGESPKEERSRKSSGEKGRTRTPSGEKQKKRIPSGDQKDFASEDMQILEEKKILRWEELTKDKLLADKKIKPMKKMKTTDQLIPSEVKTSEEVLGESRTIRIQLEIAEDKCDSKTIEKQSSVTSVELNAAVRSISPTDDVLELDIEPCDAFEDELDFEPEETTTEEAGGNVYFKSLNTNFKISKVDKADRTKPDENETTIAAKTKSAEVELEKKNERPRLGRERSRSRNRAERSSVRPGRRSRSRRRKSRSVSRRRRSKSRNRSRSRNGRKSGKSPRKNSVSRKRSPSRERGRTNRRRRSRSKKRGKEPRSLSRKRVDERRRRPSSRSRLEKLSRRSQSLSPARIRSRSPAPEIDLDHVEIEDGMSLDSLEKIKQQLMGKMGLNEDLEPVNKDEKGDVEEGEITDTEDEEVQDILKKKSHVDLRQKLARKSRPTSKTGSDKENEEKSNRKSSKDTTRQPAPIGIKACLKEYSAEDIDNKLIPFKKRQFHELQFEELKIRKQIERARSKSSTPVRSVSESSASDCPQNNSASSCISSYPPDNPIVDLKMSPMVDIRVSPIKMKSPAVRDRRVSRSNSQSDDSLPTGHRSRKGSMCEQKDGPSISKDPVSPSESGRKVSPIKLSLRGVVIERPSSSSSEANVETVEVILEKVENSSQEEKLQLQQDDNAVFPATPPKASIDVRKDLCLTDDSDFEESPVKIFNQLQSHISPFRRPEGPLDLSSPKRPPLTPKTNIKPVESDISSPLGISNLLKSPLVSHSLLSPVASSRLCSDLSFSQAVTSTPSPSLPTSVSNLKIPQPPSFLQSPKPSNIQSEEESANNQLKKKKRKVRLGRSVTVADTQS